MLETWDIVSPCSKKVLNPAKSSENPVKILQKSKKWLRNSKKPGIKKAQNSGKIILEFFFARFQGHFRPRTQNLPTILAFVPVLLVSDIFAFFLTAKKYE